MAIELGALSLAIRDDGGAKVLQTVGQIDSAARKLGNTTITPRFDRSTYERAMQGMRQTQTSTDAVKSSQMALNKEIAEGTRLFGLQARTVDVTSQRAVAELRASAAAQKEWLATVGASTEQQLRFGQATEVLERRLQTATFQQERLAAAANRTAGQTTILGRSVTNSAGAIVGAGRSSLTAINAVAFGISQLAASGETSFRSLATAVSSFAAFFGPYGAIASIVTSTGLALTDFFSRRSREISDLAQKAIDESRRASREVKLAFDRGDFAGLTAQAEEIARGTIDKKGLNELQADAAELESQIAAKKFLINRLAGEQTEAERGAARRELANLKKDKLAVDAQVQAAQLRLDQVRTALERLPDARADRGAIKVTATALKEQKDTIDQQIAALKTLAELRKVDVRALQTAQALETRLTAELAKQGQSLEQQAQTLARLNALRRTGLTLQAPTKLAESRTLDLKPAEKITISNKDRLALGLERETAPVLTDFEEMLASGLTSAIVTGLGSGFANGLAQGGIGEGFKQLGGQMLAGLGDVFLQVGAKAILGSAFIQSIASGLATLNPFVAIAAGTALLALAATMKARSGGGGGGRTSFGGSSSFNGSGVISDPSIRRATLPVGARPGSARAMAPAAGPTIQVIGIDSPQGQRLIGTASQHFTRRGG